MNLVEMNTWIITSFGSKIANLSMPNFYKKAFYHNIIILLKQKGFLKRNICTKIDLPIYLFTIGLFILFSQFIPRFRFRSALLIPFDFSYIFVFLAVQLLHCLIAQNHIELYFVAPKYMFMTLITLSILLNQMFHDSFW